ncbi:hypothetical protein FOA52_012740 [Chlamydomonas sp. UWO 241]|nr:hypothetical protein FOA52_012740 [Chlamydomonas sp. UWO 241]
MRHRLDKHGKRYGRVIDYKSSELRVVELLQGLCEDLGASLYTVNISASGRTTNVWWRYKEPADVTSNGTRLTGDKENARAKELRLFCGSIIEEYDEQIEGAIMGGKFDAPGSVSPALCQEMLKVCPDKAVPPVWVEEPVPEGTTEGGDGAGAAPGGEEAEEQEQAKDEGGAAAEGSAEAERQELGGLHNVPARGLVDILRLAVAVAVDVVEETEGGGGGGARAGNSDDADEGEDQGEGGGARGWWEGEEWNAPTWGPSASREGKGESYGWVAPPPWVRALVARAPEALAAGAPVALASEALTLLRALRVSCGAAWAARLYGAVRPEAKSRARAEYRVGPVTSNRVAQRP